MMGQVDLQKYLRKNAFRVAIFGSARIKKTDSLYKQIHLLGKKLGEEGIDVVTGGGPGLMEAANSGHRIGSRKTKAHSIGLNIKLPREQKPNKHLDFENEFSRFTARLDEFMALSNIIVVAPGGVGTMLELFYSWQLVQVGHVCDMKIILLGDMWKDLVKWLEEEALKKHYFTKFDLEKLKIAEDYEEAMRIIEKEYDDFKSGKNKSCINYEKYRLLTH